MTLHSERLRAKALLAKLSVVAEAPAVQIGASSGTGKPGHRVLEGTLPERARTHSFWLGVFTERWHDERGLSRAVDEAGEELDGFQHAPPIAERTEESHEELVARIVKEGEGWPIRECTIYFRTSERIVIAARKKDAREPHNGKPRMPDAPDNRREKARVLRESGMGLRAIGQVLDAHHQQVRRWLDAA